MDVLLHTPLHSASGSPHTLDSFLVAMTKCLAKAPWRGRDLRWLKESVIMGKAWGQSGSRQKNAGTQLAFSFLFSLEPYERSQPTVRVGLPIQFSHIRTPLERSSEVCLLHSSRGQILLFVSYLASILQCLNSQRKPSNAHPHAKWLHILTDYITPILQKGKRSLRWEQKWPEVSMRPERTRDRTLGLPGQPTESANCQMLTLCALSGLWGCKWEPKTSPV